MSRGAAIRITREEIMGLRLCGIGFFLSPADCKTRFNLKRLLIIITGKGSLILFEPLPKHRRDLP
tara:strand:+ start:1174 stop:1368 length:195 start_codon:yes stop_codon:yes gene_type:complete